MNSPERLLKHSSLFLVTSPVCWPRLVPDNMEPSHLKKLVVWSESLTYLLLHSVSAKPRLLSPFSTSLHCSGTEPCPPPPSNMDPSTIALNPISSSHPGPAFPSLYLANTNSPFCISPPRRKSLHVAVSASGYFTALPSRSDSWDEWSLSIFSLIICLIWGGIRYLASTRTTWGDWPLGSHQ